VAATEELEQEMAACRELAGSALAAEGLSSSELGPLSERLRSRIAAERGVQAKLQSLRTRQQVALVWGVAAVLIVVAAVVLPRRPDLEAYPLGRMIATIAALAALAAAATWRILRPLHRPPTSPWVERGLLLFGVLLPGVLTVVPLSHVGVHSGTGAVFAIECGRCAAYGGVMGLPILVLVMLARRARVDGVVGGALAGVAAGLMGNLTLQLHCPNTDISHQLIGHWGLLVVLPALLALWALRRR
jgi:hypothetical protein